ncbi:hypothetical protein LZ31DRAFT_77147 [Colletotrichum somersetense]|nr:hypothetical protein LZ31DRAFT_77147 [Colletotrichum somersetense]
MSNHVRPFETLGRGQKERDILRGQGHQARAGNEGNCTDLTRKRGTRAAGVMLPSGLLTAVAGKGAWMNQCVAAPCRQLSGKGLVKAVWARGPRRAGQGRQLDVMFWPIIDDNSRRPIRGTFFLWKGRRPGGRGSGKPTHLSSYLVMEPAAARPVRISVRLPVRLNGQRSNTTDDTMGEVGFFFSS